MQKIDLFLISFYLFFFFFGSIMSLSISNNYFSLKKAVNTSDIQKK